MDNFYSNGADVPPDADPADAGQWGGKGRGSHGKGDDKKANGKSDDKTGAGDGRQAPGEPEPLPLLWLEDIQPVLEARDFVQGTLVEQGSAVLYGDSNAGKTFWITDLALHVAAGIPWNGKRVQQGGVVYCCLEGGNGFKNRVFAWKQAVKDDLDLDSRVPFAAIPACLNLLNPEADTVPLVDAIKAAAKQISVPVKLIVIDTLARAMAGGNENSPDDMGLLVSNVDFIREQTGAAVLFVHHCGKDQAKGARGHSSLRAAIDTEIEVRSDEQTGERTATVVKQRDLPKGEIFGFTLDVVTLGTNQYGEAVTSCLVTHTSDPTSSELARLRLSGNNQIGAKMLRRALSKHGHPLPETSEFPRNVQAVTEAEWRQTFYAGFPGENADTKRKTFNRVKRDLLANDVVTSVHDLVWFSRRADE
jgi:hypothetical protein